MSLARGPKLLGMSMLLPAVCVAFHQSAPMMRHPLGRIWTPSGVSVRFPKQLGSRVVGARRTQMQGGGFGFGKTTKDTFAYTGTQRPSEWPKKLKTVPKDIMKPEYAVSKDGQPKVSGGLKFPWDIHVNSPEEIEGIRKSARYAREVLDIAGQAVKAGVSTEELDILVHEETVKRGGYPSPLNYCGFPKSVCTSINEVVCHGIPCKGVKLKEGDIINIDVTVFCDGYHGDCSEMFCVGEVDEDAKKLIQTTYDCWQAAIAVCKPGVQYSNIGGIIEDIAKQARNSLMLSLTSSMQNQPSVRYLASSTQDQPLVIRFHPQGMTTTRNFCGHGVGSVFHTNPTILHYKNSVNNGVMAPGHIFTIEPMINEGQHNNVMWTDGWTATTSDGKRSAQFEHTLLITETGVEPLTAKTEASPKQWWER